MHPGRRVCCLCAWDGNAERAQATRPGRLAQAPRRLQTLAATAVSAGVSVVGGGVLHTPFGVWFLLTPLTCSVLIIPLTRLRIEPYVIVFSISLAQRVAKTLCPLPASIRDVSGHDASPTCRQRATSFRQPAVYVGLGTFVMPVRGSLVSPKRAARSLNLIRGIEDCPMPFRVRS